MVWGRVVGSRSPHTQVGSYRLGRCVGFTTSWLLRVLKEETHCINYKRKFHFQIIVQHERNFAILLCIEARIDPEWFRVEMLLNFAVCILQHWHTMIVRWGDTMCFIDISFSKTKFSLEMSHQCCVRNSFFFYPSYQTTLHSITLCLHQKKSLPILPASCWFFAGPPMFKSLHNNNAATQWSQMIRQTPSWGCQQLRRSR